MKKLASIIILFSLSTVSQAELPDTYGVGNNSCEMYLDQGKDHVMKSKYIAWLQGYVSGAEMYINAAHNNARFTTSDVDEMSKFVDIYCSENQSDTFLNAADKLVEKLTIKE